MREKDNRILISPLIKAVLITLTLVAITQIITSGIFVYRLQKGRFPTRTEMQTDHQRLQNTADSILKKLDKPN